MTGATAFPLLEQIAEKRRELDALHAELSARRSLLPAPRVATRVLCFRVGEFRAAMPLEFLDEVVAMPALTALPGAPDWIAGLLRVGDERLAVVDPAVFQGGSRRTLRAAQFLILAHASVGRFAFVVDALGKFESIPLEALHRPSAGLPHAPHVIGVATLSGEETLVFGAEVLHPFAWIAPSSLEGSDE